MFNKARGLVITTLQRCEVFKGLSPLKFGGCSVAAVAAEHYSSKSLIQLGYFGHASCFNTNHAR
jgi:hypothetical protein